MKAHALFGGRLRVWWITGGRRELASAAAVVGIFAVFGLVGHFDMADAENQARMMDERRAAVQADLDELRASATIPPTVFLIEARTVDDAKNKLATVAGQLDAERARLSGLQTRSTH